MVKKLVRSELYVSGIETELHSVTGLLNQTIWVTSIEIAQGIRLLIKE